MSSFIPPEENTSSESEAVQGTSSPQVVETSKVAAADLLSVLKLVWKDPANGLQEALITLGDTRAFNAGIALGALYVLACWLGVLKAIDFLSVITSLFSLGFGRGFVGQLDFSAHFLILLSASIPVIGLIVVLWGTNKIFKGAGNYQQFTFVTGVSLAPITFFLLLVWLLGASATNLITLVGFFCFTTFILLLNTSLIGVMRLSARNALLLVPTILVVDMFITKVIFEILY